MDFLDPKKQRAHRTRLVVGYFLISISVALVTAIVALMVYGYGYNPQTGKVIQNGLVFVDSKPVSARLSVNGQDKGQTASRLLLPEDNYSFLLRRDGYRDWQTNVFISGGTIERLVYALLLPTQLTTKSIKNFNNLPTLASQSPDHKNLLVLRSSNINSLENYDLTAKVPSAKQINVSGTLANSVAKNSSWQVIEWSTDSRKVLVSHDIGQSTEYLIIDIFRPARSVNLSKIFNNDVLSDVHLHDGKVDQVYYRNKTNQLKLVDIGNKREVLVLNNIAAYKAAGSAEIAYITVPKSRKTQANFGVYAGGLHTVHTLPNSKSYFIDMINFDDHWYAAAGSSLDHKIYVYKDPVQQLATVPDKILVPITVLKSADIPASLSFSPGKQFVSLQSGSSFEVYDVQTARLYDYDTKLSFGTGQKANWLDDYHLYTVSKGKIMLWDLNGDNQQSMISARNDLPVALAPNDQSVFSFGSISSSKTKAILQQTSLLLPQ